MSGNSERVIRSNVPMNYVKIQKAAAEIVDYMERWNLMGSIVSLNDIVILARRLRWEGSENQLVGLARFVRLEIASRYGERVAYNTEWGR